jgi:catechol 2,3-dioxygenase
VHLRVAETDETRAFYTDVVGFDVTAQLGSQAVFLSAGGYHHHLGGNTWESAGRPQAPDGYATLTRITIVLPDEDALDEVARRAGGTEVRDPSGNPVAFVTAG